MKVLKGFLAALCLLVFSGTANAVLREDNLDKTIVMLYSDLSAYQNNLEMHIAHYNAQRQEYRNRMFTTLENCQEYALILYTQDDYYLFGLVQACQQINDEYAKFVEQKYPFVVWKNNFKDIIQRYNKLAEVLGHISDAGLTAQGKADKQKCIDICNSVSGRLEAFHNLLNLDNLEYQEIAGRMKKIQDYQDSRFSQIKNRIFLTGSGSYFYTLGHFGEKYREAAESFTQEYSGGQMASKEWQAKRLQVTLYSLGLLAIAIIISWLLFAFALPKKVRNHPKRKYFIACSSIIMFALLLLIIINCFLTRYYFIVTMSIVMELTLIIGVILSSIVLRLPTDKIRQGILLYLAPVLLAVVLVSYRILMVTTYVVSFSLPLVLLIFATLHLVILLRRSNGANRADSLLSWFSFILTIGILILSWAGYRFLSMGIMTSWLLLLASILFTLCLYHLLNLVAKYKTMEEEEDASKRIFTFRRWFNPLMKKLVFPLMFIGLLVFSLIWGAGIFSMRAWMTGMIGYCFINVPDMASVSFEKILYVIGLGCIFNYVIFMTRKILITMYAENYEDSHIPIYVKIGTILAWLIYAFCVIFILQLNNKGLIAALGGAGMGIGFALKDAINNLFCGISLMMGRVHKGDWVECDGYRGKIVDIGMDSSTLETEEGSIITFLNEQLFSKNFMNLTKNHQFELSDISINVKYGENIDKARELLLEELLKLKCIAPGRPPKVLLTDFTESSVRLTVYAWTPVSEIYTAHAAIRETIYRVFSNNHIEIPYPQQDIRIIQSK
ncbi:MAG: mechanosensitive ion channel family protein [Bacteroidales bacterium]|jgi:small-conductance mechanosensitive channel|nr:mechanosensitive ion channel family protein [Bacteroidales bacterium]